jgi:hypothetical protein
MRYSFVYLSCPRVSRRRTGERHVSARTFFDQTPARRLLARARVPDLAQHARETVDAEPSRRASGRRYVGESVALRPGQGAAVGARALPSRAGKGSMSHGFESGGLARRSDGEAPRYCSMREQTNTTPPLPEFQAHVIYDHVSRRRFHPHRQVDGRRRFVAHKRGVSDIASRRRAHGRPHARASSTKTGRRPRETQRQRWADLAAEVIHGRDRPAYLSTVELLNRFGRSRRTLARWRHSANFPVPMLEFHGEGLWLRLAVVAWGVPRCKRGADE